MKKYDLAIIGAGTGGYNAAIRAAQLGMNVVLIEKAKVGGLCLQWGCIPSKILLHYAKLYHDAKRAVAEGALIAPGLSFDYDAMVAVSRRRVATETAGLKGLLSSHRIIIKEGTARFMDAHHLIVATDDEPETVTAGHILIAAGRSYQQLPGYEVDHHTIIASDDAMSLTAAPKRIAIIGGGVEAVEFASLFNALDVPVSILKARPGLLRTLDDEIATELETHFRNSGVEMVFDMDFEHAAPARSDRGIELTVRGERRIFDKMLMSIGIDPRPVSGSLNLAAAGVDTDERGFIRVNPETYGTSTQNIHAIGDIISLPCRTHPGLAHAAGREGEYVAELLGGKNPPRINYDWMPYPVFTIPDLASVGLSEAQARERYKDAPERVLTGRFRYEWLGKALALNTPTGLVKVVVDGATGEILGCHIFGEAATEYITEAAEAMRAEDVLDLLLDRQITSHPTFSEALKEAFGDVLKRSIHTPPR
ncbi:NAD(P)/FAD-dependent oxidoreductase [bacterium]|nr:NAD(P)/FAD-dependent oxidoreductase [candidate division CSSED10-310 bacterium]